jgi:hypothetical protein
MEDLAISSLGTGGDDGGERGSMKYRDFVPRLAQEYEAELGRIASVHNFELGDEFEIAMCEVFRRILPERYGICRGHVTAQEGEQAGDDIIIFDRLRFPTLLSRTRDDFARKEWVPIEAVYAYIEAKHTLEIEGDGPSSLAHAAKQAARVKQLVGTRQKVPLTEIHPYLDLAGLFKGQAQPGHPDHLNPSFAAIFSRQVRKGPGGAVLHDGPEIRKLLGGRRLPSTGFPDLIVAGPDHVVVPALVSGTPPSKSHIVSPFLVPGQSSPAVQSPHGLALAIGICQLMAAFDVIQLGEMPWANIIGEGLGIRMTSR